MRIGLDVSKSGSADGLGTFTREALGALVREADGRHEFLTYDLLGEGSAEGGDGSLLALLADPGSRPAADQLDAFLATSFSAPPLPASTRLLFVVYDLTFLTLPDCHTFGNRLHCLEGLIGALAHDAELLAISEQGASELARLLGRDEAAIPVLPLAPPPGFQPLAPEELGHLLAPLGLRADGYLLSVGSLEPRKNLAALLHAHAALPADLRQAFPLVLAGSPGWKNAALTAEIAAAEAAGYVRHLGRVAQETLVALFGGAALFAYPSLAEGYGLPIVEAMACGAPVLTSNISALPETAGDAAALIDPYDEKAIAFALKRLLGATEERQQLRQRGLKRAAALSWQKTARKLLDLLEARQPSATRTLP